MNTFQWNLKFQRFHSRQCIVSKITAILSQCGNDFLLGVQIISWLGERLSNEIMTYHTAGLAVANDGEIMVIHV